MPCFCAPFLQPTILWCFFVLFSAAWEPGSLARVAEQFWPMVESKEADVGLVGYSNLDPESALMAAFNVFILTRELINRCGRSV